MTRAIALAYHDVGVRCLSVLLEHEIDVPLVVTHKDDPAETIWFASVRDLALTHGIPVITPEMIEAGVRTPDSGGASSRQSGVSPQMVEAVDALLTDWISWNWSTLVEGGSLPGLPELTRDLKSVLCSPEGRPQRD